MDLQKYSNSKILQREHLIKAHAVDSPVESSGEDKSDEELNKMGSRIRLFQDKKKNVKPSRKSRSEKSVTKSADEKSENAIVHVESKEPVKTSQVPKESSIAQSIKRKFAFFRRSENVKSSKDVEAAIVESVDTQESESEQRLDVVVDVYRENEQQEKQTIKKSASSTSLDDARRSDDTEEMSSSEDLVIKSLDTVEEFHEEATVMRKKNLKTNLFHNDSDVAVESEIDVPSLMHRDNDKSIDKVVSEVLPTSGGDSSHRRKRWERSEISASNLVEDLKKPRRRQWAKDSASADVHKIIEKKNSVPKRSATANPDQLTRFKSVKTSTPIAAPRSKSIHKQDYQAFDNDGFTFDQDEVLRIETIDDSSPKIEISNSSIENIEDAASSLSENEDKLTSSAKPNIEKIKVYSPTNSESTENSDTGERSLTASSESLDFNESRRITKRRLRKKQKSFADDRFINDKDENDENDENDEIDDDEDELDTVLNVMEKKSRRSSNSSKIEIIPSNFFDRKFTDDTTISTNEDMNTSRKNSQRSRSRSKSKSSARKRRDNAEDTSMKSSPVKCKTTSSSTRNSTEEYSSSRRKAKSKTRKRLKRREQEHREDAAENMKYVSIRIHRSDILEADYITRHPMVKVHIVNMVTGEYLNSSNNEKNNAETLQPIITAKFDFKEKKSMTPIWEEELIFEKDFKDILNEGKDSTLILFEIVDLLNFSEASVCYDQFGRDACWYKVAWAFLRPVGKSGVHHVDKRLRLQLYRPIKNVRKLSHYKCEVYRWWKLNSRDDYPSSLYVTLSPVDPPKLEPVFYEQLMPLEDIPEVRDFSQQASLTRTDVTELPKWTRTAVQSCQISNETHVEVEASENGCFHLAFSNDGKYLACALSEEYDYPILVYKVHDGKVHVRFSGHKNFIYSLSWSRDDRFLLSVSSDRTARFWDVRERIIEHVQFLPHPSYVYCGKFSLELSDYIVTGCYDRMARVWARLRSNGTEQYELVQELEAHESFVNSLCFQSKNDIFFTGDGVGVVIAWSAKRSRRSPMRKEWQIMRKIKIRELEGVPINTIVMHPLGSRLLVHSRNNGLRLLDLLSGTVVKKFDGLMNQRIQITACISPCGNLLFCGGEDSKLNVWSLEKGKHLAVYEVEVHEKAVTCVDYHPTDHVLAFTIYGAPVPVKILKFDREADGKSVGLKLLTTTMNMTTANSFSKFNTQSVIVRNGGRNSQMLSTKGRNSSINVSQYGFLNHILTEHKDNDEARVHVKGKMDNFVGNGMNLKTKSMNRLNGIIEKIDRILMYATSQKSPVVDLESARNSSILTVTERQTRRTVQTFELKDLTVEEKKKRSDNISKKHRQRSRSERNSCSSTYKETDVSKAFSDSAAFNRKVSRFSDDSSNSNRSAVHKKLVVERLNLEKIDYVDTESELKDTLDTIIDGKEDFTSEEILDIESLKSDDTYTVEKENKALNRGDNDLSDGSNATFIIESEIPIPKPRKRIGRIEVM